MELWVDKTESSLYVLIQLFYANRSISSFLYIFFTTWNQHYKHIMIPARHPECLHQIYHGRDEDESIALHFICQMANRDLTLPLYKEKPAQ